MKSKSYFMYIFHKFDSFSLFDFNIAKMHIFCSFLKKDYCCFREKDNFYWQPIPKNNNASQIWSDGTDFRTEPQKFFNARTMHIT